MAGACTCAVLVATNRQPIIAGVITALALVPAAAITCICFAYGDFGQAGKAFVRLLVELSIALVVSLPVPGWKKASVQKRKMHPQGQTGGGTGRVPKCGKQFSILQICLYPYNWLITRTGILQLMAVSPWHRFFTGHFCLRLLKIPFNVSWAVKQMMSFHLSLRDFVPRGTHKRAACNRQPFCVSTMR